MHDIDFVLTYLDSNDEAWQIEKAKYKYGDGADVSINRYREWDNLKYFFRGIEKCAPWVRKIHLVTCGHVPAWLNINHPKLNIVNHKDYIPAEWLPTFSSRCIDMNLHRIPDLAEHFVYFNDDMFLITPVSEEDFFHNGLPCDTPTMRAAQYVMVEDKPLHLAPIIDTSLINKHFSMRDTVRAKPLNWLNPKYGKFNAATLISLPYINFVGFRALHLPYSYLKSTYETVWEMEGELCAKTCSHKFREGTDLNHWVFTYWQYATNQFYPRSVKEGFCFQLHSMPDAKLAAQAIRNRKHKMICINDSLESDDEFDSIRDCVNIELERIFPQKSDFEKPSYIDRFNLQQVGE